MKKIILTSCCLMAMIIFCANIFAGDGKKKAKKNGVKQSEWKYDFSDAENGRNQNKESGKLDPSSTFTCTYCCVVSGTVNVDCAAILGKPCAAPKPIGLGCEIGDCPDSWYWEPGTYLSNQNVEFPLFRAPTMPSINDCCPTSESIEYTITAWNSLGNCCAQKSEKLTVNFLWCLQPGVIACCRIGHFASDEEKENNDIAVMSDPGSDIITIELKTIPEGSLLQVYGMNGALVKEMKIQEKTMLVDLSNNAKGVYFIQVIRNEVGLLNKKILIQ